MARCRLGFPTSDRTSGEDRWLTYEGVGWFLRVRLRPLTPGEVALVRSWTMRFEPGYPTLESACAVLGIRTSEVVAGRVPSATVQCPFPDPDSERVDSLTATVRDDAVVAVTGFDEPPDWLPGDEST
jgi:hypothetical protein